MQLQHTALHVADLDAAIAFYEDALGLSHTWDFEHEGVVNYYIGSANGVELQFKHDEDADPPSPAGIDHVALIVDDVDATFERVVEETDCPVVVAPTYIEPADRYVAFVEDPNGYVVEFVENPEA